MDGTRCRDRLRQGKMRPGNFVFDEKDPRISNVFLRQKQHEGVALSWSIYNAALVLLDPTDSNRRTYHRALRKVVYRGSTIWQHNRVY